MGLYSRYIFPWGMDRAMQRPEITALREELLAAVRGEVFELGFGTGLNLAHYPRNVRRIAAVDPNPGMSRRAEKRIAASPIPVDRRELSGERLPFVSERFDSVVSTWTLCSIPDVRAALHEVRRILKPRGRFYLVEHGLAEDPKVRAWQRRLNPLQMCYGDGCRLDRDIRALVIEAGFKFQELETFYLDGHRESVGFTYRGVAVKA
ncbi:MAG: class I SAM-dependent methyltransferase [Myxococcales bacterium]|nr:class I SAM-dependent methyltransferase [Myxococcales bacterium]